MFENLSKLGEWLKKIWIPVTSFLGAITLIVQFIKLWRGNKEDVTWATAILSSIVLISFLTWVGFSKSENSKKLLLPENFISRSMRFPKSYKYAQICLLLLILSMIGASYSLFRRMEDLDNKVIVLITNFDGPDSTIYRVTEIIWENIYSALRDYDDVELITSDEVIKSFSEAEKEGVKYNATIVIWGWYSVTDELARVTIHFDILNPPNSMPSEFINQEAMRDFQIGEFQNFIVQEQLSDEMTFLSLTTIGLVRYSLEDWEGAISSFNNALYYTDNNDFIKETQYYLESSSVNLTTTTPTPGNRVIIFVAQNIPAGVIITGDLIGYMQIPSDNYVSIIISRPEDVIGKYAKFPLDKGVVLTQSMIVNPTDWAVETSPQWAPLEEEASTLQFLLEQFSIPILPTSTANPIP